MCTIARGWVISKPILLSPVQTDATLLANNSQHCWMLHVTSISTTCCMLLDVVTCCCAKFETGQTFQPTTPNISFVSWSPKRSATMLDSFAQLFQHYWGHARSLRMVYKDLCVVSFPRCTARPNIVGSCCAKFEAGQTLSQQLPTFLLFRDRRSVAQQCWISLHSSFSIVGATHAHSTWPPSSYKFLSDVSSPRCIAGAKIVGGCCIYLHV